MNIAVRYYSRGGNTKKLAAAIAKEAGVAAENCSAPLTEAVDILFLGGSIYGIAIDPALKEFIANLDASKVGRAAVFASSAIKKAPQREIEDLLRQKNIPVSSHSFSCKGAFAFLHRGRPNGVDDKQAAAFARTVLEEAR